MFRNRLWNRPPETINLATVKSAGEYRTNEVVRIRLDEIRAGMIETNEARHNFNWRRTLLHLDQLRRGTCDVYSDNLAQYQNVVAIIDELTILKREKAKDRRTSFREFVRPTRLDNSSLNANSSSSKTPDKPNPFFA